MLALIQLGQIVVGMAVILALIGLLIISFDELFRG